HQGPYYRRLLGRCARASYASIRRCPSLGGVKIVGHLTHMPPPTFFGARGEQKVWLRTLTRRGIHEFARAAQRCRGTRGAALDAKAPAAGSDMEGRARRHAYRNGLWRTGYSPRET